MENPRRSGKNLMSWRGELQTRIVVRQSARRAARHTQAHVAPTHRHRLMKSNFGRSKRIRADMPIASRLKESACHLRKAREKYYREYYRTRRASMGNTLNIGSPTRARTWELAACSR